MKKVNKNVAAEVEKAAQEAKAVAEVAVLEAKEETQKLAQDVKEVKAAAKTDVKEAEAKARKAEAKVKKDVKDAEDKAKKAVKKTARKVAKKAEAVKISSFVQFAGLEVSVEELQEKARAAFRAEHKRMPIKSISLYVKPEDHAAYYVVNEEHTGKVEL